VHSCLYEGRVRHRRLRPVEHVFDFPLAMLYLDLDELARVFRGRWLWSTRRPAFAWFRRRDHLGDPERPLDACVRDLVEVRSGVRPRGPIRLLTQLRYAGTMMNPVSFYYCYGPDGEDVEAIVADVTNTPWGERHAYVLPVDRSAGQGRALRFRTPKEFHVSPFMDMEMAYRWAMSEPGSHLSVRIANHEPDGARLFDAVLSMRRREVTGRSLAGVLVRYPLMGIQTFAGIYWQALRLYGKGAVFYPHPRAREPQLETTT